ncbi:MAG: hypothetical protein AAF587_03070 [Bacteroidota bacterium]
MTNLIFSYSILIFFFPLFCRAEGSNFTIYEIPEYRIKNLSLYIDSSEEKRGLKLYQIIFRGDTSNAAILSYSRIIQQMKSSGIDKIELIEELLLVKNDSRLSCVRVLSYDSSVSQIYDGKRRYSIQLAALFLINYLYFDSFWYSPYPILRSLFGVSRKGVGVMIAHKKYNKWIRKVKQTGIEESRKRGLFPLESLFLFWYK